MSASYHEVPTHLNVEDKVALGLSVRQFLYVLVGSSSSYVVWQHTATLPDAMRGALMCLSVCVTLAFALLRPAGRPLEEWVVALLLYLAADRSATWQPAEPSVHDWRPMGVAWQELQPTLAWLKGD